MATEQIPGKEQPDWRDPASYAYTQHLTREGWAWEFLRRNPKYRMAWHEHAGKSEVGIRSLPHGLCLINAARASRESRNWGLVIFEDPDSTAPASRVFWSPDLSSFVLPLNAIPPSGGDAAQRFQLPDLQCNASLLTLGALEQHLLFSDEGRRFQIAVTGADILAGARLFTDAHVSRGLLERRLQALRRLSHLAGCGRLAPRLYPPDPRRYRLRRLLQALDGDIDRSSRRDIAGALFGASRVNADWADPGDNLRDQARRAVRRARWLMNGGYLTLLK